MPWTPRGGKALARAASGRVPGPRTTDSSLNGIMLMIIFITVLMVASFEHSLPCGGRPEGPGGIYEIRRAGRKAGTAREAHSHPRGGRGLGGTHTAAEAPATAGGGVATARGRQDGERGSFHRSVIKL